MAIKLCVFVLLFGCFLKADAQITNEVFVFGENQNISYHRILGGERSAAKFYVIFNECPQFEKEMKRCSINRDYKMFFTLTIPPEFQTEKEREELFLAFASRIMNTTKLIDSEMYVISDKDYAGLYERIRQQNGGHYNYGKLNEIHKIYINKPLKEICEIINN